ncbi:hypothetical protein [Alloscardovia omnicolens]|jgi:hypothetical protein|uniref:hypothetical protein n=1 Tax=Alloscardovia omnicolens TaxID=419015 RepID=UPI0006693387|nr:hypothetical protein [Alloscardovia omnicolens]
MSAHAQMMSYPIHRIRLTINQLKSKESELKEEFGSIEDLYLKQETIGLTVAERNAMEQLRNIRFLLDE